MSRPIFFALLTGLALSATHSRGDELNIEQLVEPSAGTSEALLGDWRGWRSKFADRGVQLSLDYISEVLVNTRGGKARGGNFDALAVVHLDLDFQKLVGWPGAKAEAVFIYPHGSSPTEQRVGDLGTVSNLDFYDSRRLFQLWFEQSFFAERFSMRVGLLAADEEFLSSEYAEVFINSSFGPPTAISANTPIPAYGIGALGLRLKVQPTASSYFQIAVFDGNPAPAVLTDPTPAAAGSNEFNHYGTHWALRDDEGALLIAEIGASWNEPEADEKRSGKEAKPRRRLATRLKLGGLYHTDRFAEVRGSVLTALDSNRAPEEVPTRRGNYAIYAVAEQELWREPGSDEQGLGAFLHATFAPSARNYVDRSVETGLHYRGLLPGRDDDVAGVGFSYLGISSDVTDATRDANASDGGDAPTPHFEAILEITYQLRVSSWFTLQPDIQWVIRPGGTREFGNALVVGLRSAISF